MTAKIAMHGGARKGSGRKPAPVKMSSFRISIAPDVHQWFVAEAVRRGVSVSSLYALAASEYRKINPVA
jgi:hypothetical protein